MISTKKREPLPPGDYSVPIKGYKTEAPYTTIVDIENAVPMVFGDQLLDEVIKDPTINIYLDRSPKLNTQPDYEEMVRRLQRQRAIFINAEQKKKEPKIEGEN